jgi:hypothetical protein
VFRGIPRRIPLLGVLAPAVTGVSVGQVSGAIPRTRRGPIRRLTTQGTGVTMAAASSMDVAFGRRAVLAPVQ